MKFLSKNRVTLFLVAVLLAFSMLFTNVTGERILDNMTVFEGEDVVGEGSLVVMKAKTDVRCDDEAIFEARLFGLIPIKTVSADVLENKKLIVGGMPFGIKMFTNGVIVVGMGEITTQKGSLNPSIESGIELGDIITKINGKNVATNEDVGGIVKQSAGAALNLEIKRGESTISKTIIPARDNNGEYKIGLWVRDSTAGIGTMTFIDPNTGYFGGLGHAICDVDTGEIMPLLQGSAVCAKITGVIKGKKGVPGELTGMFMDDFRIGSLYNNCNAGVYGTLDDMTAYETSDIMLAGKQSEVIQGKAEIICDVGNGRTKYDIEITKVMTGTSDTKNMVIEITDERLLDITGGIVQGMSGSPIIQNNKLIGAVTHVLVNDPTRGYGIFIENMLAQKEK